jgi:putative tryptophan/tyrosine transport system substrate-binding protein
MTSANVELTAKRLQVFKEALPSISRVAVLIEPGIPGDVIYPAMLRETEIASQASGVQAQLVRVNGADELNAAFAAMAAEHAEALYVIPGPFALNHRARIAELAATHRLPGIAANQEFAATGLLMSYGANNEDLVRRSAAHVDKILKGARPADLPVERPVKFEFAINLRTARALGLTIPASVLAQATEIIE